MKVIELEGAADPIGRMAADARRQRVVLTRGGRPVAIVVGLAHYDAEDLALMSDPAFWQMIEERRKQPTIPIEEVRRRLGIPARRRRASVKRRS